MASASAIHIGADENVTLTGMTGGGAYLNSASVATWSLKLASTGAEVASGNLSYVASSNGNYLGVIPSSVTATLTEDARYWIDITFRQGDYDDRRRLVRRAAYRERT